jgi:very-short-patch-repair endonuclease
MAFNPFGTGLVASIGPTGKKSPVIGPKRPNGLLTSVEVQALNLIEKLSPTSQYRIFPQVHVLQIFDVNSTELDKQFDSHYVSHDYRDGIAHQIKTAWNYEMGWKSIDFLICEPTSTRVVGGIEIDDRSHQEPERHASDLVKNILFASAGIPLLRFTNADILQFSKLPVAQHQSTYQSLINSSTQSWNTTAKAL